MITYEPKTWFKFIFKFHKSDAFRTLFPSMLALCAVTAVFVYLDINYLKFELKNSTFFHQVIGFVLSMLLVFRINTAYDRWWEGRKQWGSLVNNSRNLALKINSLVSDEYREEKKQLGILISNYALSLKEHLRDSYRPDELEFFTKFEQGKLDKASHKPNFVANEIFKRLYDLHNRSIINSDHLIVINEELRSLTEVTGACERIKNTPIPYSYSLYLKRIIFTYVVTMPFAFAIDFGYLAVAVVALIFYTFASLELVSEEIEDPFGLDPNDLPTDEISGKIKESVHEILSF
ncbi:MAG: bestrophin family ion channel [Bacteroidota bacterium]|nr:bestrophin family ion channel [Bacteroidota bacterium]